MNISLQSPNRSSRHGAAITMLVMHATVGNKKSALSWMISKSSGVSAHYFIDKKGEIYLLVPEVFAAWHAGASAHLGLNSVQIQRCSIGIELENKNDGKDSYPKSQYDATVNLSREIIQRHNIPSDNLVRHLDIAVPFGRKTDPAGFPWTQFRYDCYRDIEVTPKLGGFVTRYDHVRVREKPTVESEITGMIDRAGTVFLGEVIRGELYKHPTIGSSNQWVKLSGGSSSSQTGFVWSKLVERY